MRTLRLRLCEVVIHLHLLQQVGAVAAECLLRALCEPILCAIAALPLDHRFYVRPARESALSRVQPSPPHGEMSGSKARQRRSSSLSAVNAVSSPLFVGASSLVVVHHSTSTCSTRFKRKMMRQFLFHSRRSQKPFICLPFKSGAAHIYWEGQISCGRGTAARTVELFTTVRTENIRNADARWVSSVLPSTDSRLYA